MASRSSRTFRRTPAMPLPGKRPSPDIVPSASRSPTWSGPCPMSPCSRCWTRGFKPGPHVYWRSHFLTGLPDEAIDIMVGGSQCGALADEARSWSSISAAPWRGSATTRRPSITATPSTTSRSIAMWTDPADADANIAWARELWDAMQPFARGVYVNYLGVGDDPEPRPRRLQPREVRASRGFEAGSRPGQHLPPQPEHPAGIGAHSGARNQLRAPARV